MALTVVIIDDDPDDLDFFKEAIGAVDNSINCLSFIYSEEAVQMLSNAPILLPDFIFIDINMPRKRGNECLKELRAVRNLDTIPIIMYSTSMPPSADIALRSDGASFTFQKPTRLKDYHSVLKKIFNQKDPA